MKKWVVQSILFILVVTSHNAYAHEAYVLTPGQFHEGLNNTTFTTVSSLGEPRNAALIVGTGAGIASILIIGMFLQQLPTWQSLQKTIERGGKYASILLRFLLALSFFASALTWSFLGPELHIQEMPLPSLIRMVMFGIAFLLAVGFMTRLAAFAALALYGLGVFVFGTYMLTYSNYVGEILALFLFGAPLFSVDQMRGKVSHVIAKLQSYEPALIRMLYGIALSYAAINIKFLHPILTYTVVTEYHLTRFSWLFPSDPLLVTLGAGLAELAIGLFIIIGFQTRLINLIILFYLTLSLIFFKEAVWPHFMLYGISLYLVFSKQPLSLDGLIQASLKNHKKRTR